MQKEQRFICHECHKTFSARKGTVFYRLRTSAETVVLVVTLLAHGCPVQAIVAAFRFDERTVADAFTRSDATRLGIASVVLVILLTAILAADILQPGVTVELGKPTVESSWRRAPSPS